MASAGNTIVAEPQNTNHSFSDITIKDEPIDLTDDCSDTEIHPETDSTMIIPKLDSENELVTTSTGPSVVVAATTKLQNNINTGLSSKDGLVTRKFVIDGQEKSYVIVNKTQLAKSPLNVVRRVADLTTKPQTSNTVPTNKELKVQCPRCKITVSMEEFSKHIDLCPPRYNKERTLALKSISSPAIPESNAVREEINSNKTVSVIREVINSNKTVSVMYNPFSGEIASLPGQSNRTSLQSTHTRPSPNVKRDGSGRFTIQVKKVVPDSLIPCSRNNGTIATSDDTLKQTTVKQYKNNTKSTRLSNSDLCVSAPSVKPADQGVAEPPIRSNDLAESATVPSHSKSQLIEKTVVDPKDNVKETRSKSLSSSCREEVTDSPDKNLENHAAYIDLANVIVKPTFASRRMRSRSVYQPRVVERESTENTDTCIDKAILNSESISANSTKNADSNKEIRRPTDLVVAPRTRSKSVSEKRNSSKNDPSLNLNGKNKGSKSVSDGIEGKTVSEDEKQDKTDHASQLAYYQKFLEIRNRSIIKSKNSSIANDNELGYITEQVGESVASTAEKTNLKSVNNVQQLDETLENNYSLLLADNTYSCSLCSFTTDKQKQLFHHERNHRRNSNPIYACIYCNQKYTRYSLYLHVQNVHPGQKFQIIEEPSTTEKQGTKLVESGPSSAERRCLKPNTFTCTKCPFLAKTQILLNVHMKSHAVKRGGALPNIKSAPKIFRCSKCSYVSIYNIHHIKRHQKNIHDKNLPMIQCPECDFKSSANIVTTHARKFHSNQLASIKENIIRQRAAVSDTSSTKTKDADADVVDEKDNIKDTTSERKTTFKIKPFKCPQCPFSTSLRIKLNVHIKNLHSQAHKLLKCPLCSLTTSNPYNLDQHMRCHKSNMPVLKCNSCDYTATQFALRRHYFKSGHWPETLASDSTSQHGATPGSKGTVDSAEEKVPLEKNNYLKCSECSFSTNLLIKLNMHMKIHNKEVSRSVPVPVPVRRNSDQSAPKRKSNRYSDQTRESKRRRTMTGVEKSSSVAETPLLHCTKCSFSTDIPSELKTHMKMPHVTFTKCSLCSEVAMSENELNQHMLTHERNEVVRKCPYCNFKSTENSLCIHVKEHNQRASILKCDIQSCSFSTWRSPNLIKHRLSHNTTDIIEKCRYCDFKSTPRSVSCHIKEHIGFPAEKVSIPDLPSQKQRVKRSDKSNSQTSMPNNRIERVDKHKNKKKGFDCKLCSFTSRKRNNYASHMKYHYRNQQILKCPQCSFRSFQKYLSSHIKKEHKQTPVPAAVSDMSNQLKPKTNLDNLKPIGMKCKFCSYRTNFKNTLNRHIETHIKNPPIKKCPKCSYKSTSRIVTDHIKKTHSEKAVSGNIERKHRALRSVDGPSVEKPTLQCQLCSYSTKLSARFENHAKTHETHQPIKKCTYCNYKATPRSLANHTRLHTRKTTDNKANFKCTQCSFTTAAKRFANNHLISHIKNQPIKKCPHCSYKSTPHSLQQHIRIHRPKPELGKPQVSMRADNRKIVKHKCKLCSAVLMASYMPLHNQKHAAGVFIKKCSVCDFKSFPGIVQRHIAEQGHHTNDWSSFWDRKKGSSRSVAPLAQRSQDQNDDLQDKRVTPKVRLTKVRHTKSRRHKPSSNLLVEWIASAVADTSEKQLSKSSKPVVKVEQLGSDVQETKDDQASHKKLSTSETEKKSAKFQCPLCSYSTNLRIGLNIHARKKHSESNNDVPDNAGVTTLHQKEESGAGGTNLTDALLEIEAHRDLFNSGGEEINDPSTSFQNIEDCLPSFIDQEINASSAPRNSSLKRDSYKKRQKALFQCTLCSWSGKMELNWKKHMNAHKIYNLPIYQCHYCEFKGTETMIKYHPKYCPNRVERRPTKHATKVLLNCTKCSFVTYEPLALRNHEDNDHTEVKYMENIGSIKRFKCDQCSFTTYWQYLSERHTQSHTILKLPINQCPKCEFRSTPAALAAHTSKCNKK